MIYTGNYTETRGKTAAMVLHHRLPGQRWHHLVCFGNLSHYYEDGGCEHTDAVLARCTDYGRAVTKLQPFGDGKRRPKRFATRRASLSTEGNGLARASTRSEEEE